MGKTHEALEWAEREQEKKLSIAVPVPEKRYTPPPREVSRYKDKESYEGLKINLLTRRPEEQVKTLLFSSTCHGDGASTTAINFANSLVRNSGLRVLLVDVNLRTPGLHDVYKIDRLNGFSELIADNGDPAAFIQKVGPENLYVLPSGGNHSGPANLFESNRFESFLNEMREKFDYVILDAPPVPAFSEARLICSKVDGVVLVLGSGKTRRQVALKAIRELEEAGGKILGVVLNKRKYYIPSWLYKRL